MWYSVSMMIYIRQSSKRKKPSNSKKAQAAREEHKKFLESHGYFGKKFIKTRDWTMPTLTYDKTHDSLLSNNLHESGGFKKSVDDYKWKRNRVESSETTKEIDRKRARVAPGWNKGTLIFITDDTDPTTLGRKI
jgi:hypothetical protein